jgi:hypothetical protein
MLMMRCNRASASSPFLCMLSEDHCDKSVFIRHMDLKSAAVLPTFMCSLVTLNLI